MSYVDADPTIAAWTQRHSLKLFTSFADGEARFVYVSSPMGECFQISIEPPSDGIVGVHAWDIDTRNDDEFQKDWNVPLLELNAVLEEALQTIRRWMDR